MRRVLTLLLLAAALGAQAPMNWEERFRSIPDPTNIRNYVERLSARPHHLGSPYDKDNAEWLLAKFRSWGWDAQIETFHVLFPTPKERVLEMLEPVKFTPKLSEPAVAGDPTSSQLSEQLPVYHAYSIDGDVTAPLVYVNYGVPADYDELQRIGVSVKGAIVIARYGASWRGIKPKVAAEHGAVGCLIYSDPHDDGYAQGEVFPDGPWRPKDGAQRGSVMDMPVHPGDPLTPFIGATKDAKRLPVAEAKTLTKIPVMPISWGDAQPLLEALKGPVAPAGWRGSLPITYRIGPGPARVHLKLKFNWDLAPLYNVVARIPGSDYPDEWIIRGNHHDAWVNGADDPVSAMAAMMEEARAMGELRKQGWRPRRTIIYCAWDGEEQALLGSTEWAEAHADELRRKAAIYINSDSNGRGFFGMAGSHSLERFINGVARDIHDPQTGLSAWKRAQLAQISSSAAGREEARTRADLRISPLGSGSDYTAFIDHLGIPSLNIGFGGFDGSGIYHSIYDDFTWYTKFSDSDFIYGRALAQAAGTAVMRISDGAVLPYEFGNAADTIGRYANEVKKLWQDSSDAIVETNKQLDEGVFRAVNDPRRPRTDPPRVAVPPHLNFAPLENAVDALKASAQRYTEAAKNAAPAGARVAALNQKLIAAERAVLDMEGLPNRPWFRNQIYAPGFYTGYGVKTLPGVREGIEQKNWPEAETQIARTARAIANYARAIDEAAAEFSRQ